jgi:phage-related protein
MSTFTWTPDYPLDEEFNPRVRVAKFGDGYEQRTGDGINTQPSTWSLMFTVRNTVGNQILEFLKARGAAESFSWIPPYSETMVRVRCGSWKKTIAGFDYMIIQAQFDQVFES